VIVRLTIDADRFFLTQHRDYCMSIYYNTHWLERSPWRLARPPAGARGYNGAAFRNGLSLCTLSHRTARHTPKIPVSWVSRPGTLK
jgi:hypothetical protein